MKNFHYLLIFLLGLNWLSAQSTYTYLVSNEDFLNPERGFYYPSISQDGPLTESWVLNRRSLYTPTDANYQVKSSLFFRYFMLSDFITSDISADYLQDMAADFAAVRNAGSKIIIRFSYTNTFTDTAPYGDASKARVLSHINQLAPVLQDNADVIAAVQLGFIGIWGEGYYTDYFGDASTAGHLTTTDWINRNEVIQAMLDALPENRMVQVRYPQQKQKFVYGPAAPTTSAASGGRIGFHNDCFLASDYDFGTFTNYDPWSADHLNMLTDLRTYLDADAETVAVGGETCNLNEDTPADILCATNGGRADSDLQLFNYSYLNSDYLNDVNNNWTGICLDEIKRRLGYRFELVSGTYTDQAQPGQTIQLNLSIRNTGYAAPFNPRGLEYILRNTSTNQLFYASPLSDPRSWSPGTTTAIDQTFCLPGDMPLGTYELLLHLPDPISNLYGNPAYSIRLASNLPNNTDVWESATGYNTLGHQLTVNNTAMGTNCNTQTTFASISALPVSWDIFYAYAKNTQHIQLYWENAAEQNNAGFEVQRSTDGREFTSIAWVPAQESSPYKYEYTDSKFPAVPVLYYRLKQIDHDGRTNYSIIEKVNVKFPKKQLRVYPNPSTEGFFVELGEGDERALVIYQIDGPLRWSGTHDFSTGRIWISPKLPKGAYILVATSGSDRSLARLFIH